MIVALVAAVLTAAVVVPQPGARTAAAAPAMLEASFRDLPTSVRTGDSLRVMLDVPDGSECDGSIVYRDNSSQNLPSIKSDDDRCRWDVIVPTGTRRGEADVAVTVKRGDDKNTFRAHFNVGLRAQDVALVLKDLPGSVKRDSEFTVRLDVPDKSRCEGVIYYEGSKTQALDARDEDNEECRWKVTVPGDTPRGEARVSVTVTYDGRTSTLLSSFDVSRDNDDPEMLIAFQDLPSTAPRDGALPVRVIVPHGATCDGEVRFRSAENVKLDKVDERANLCRWSLTVPNGAKRGDAEVSVTVRSDGKDTSIRGIFKVDEKADTVDAMFKDLPSSIQRGDDLEVRVGLPDGATCWGDVMFDDGEIATLDARTEKRDRCLWIVRVPAYTTRGVAVVRVWVDDHGTQTSLTGNVMVEGREDDPVSASWEKLPKEVEPSEKFEVSVLVASGSDCAGKIMFPGDLPWTLGDTTEDDSYCRWSVKVPVFAKPGTATINVKVEKKDEISLQGEFAVKGAP
jgi:hypothetical protein